MAYYPETLQNLVARVLQVKPNLGQEVAVEHLNNAVNFCLSFRPYWSDFLRRVSVSCPDAYATGTITLTPGSNVAVGSGTTFLANDEVNTTLTTAVRRIGAGQFDVANRLNVRNGDFLLVGSGASEEVVPVLWSNGAALVGRFAKTHEVGDPVTRGSHAGFTLKLTTNQPRLMVEAVRSATELILDSPWTGSAQSSVPYQMVKSIYVVDPLMRNYLAAGDVSSSQPCRVHVSYQELNYRDVQRSSTSGPVLEIVDHPPNRAGAPQVEFYPNPTSRRQVEMLIVTGALPMRSPNDSPPPFFNPQMLVDFACGKVLNMKVREDDPYYLPATAKSYMASFQDLLLMQSMEDEARALNDYSQHMGYFSRWGGADFYQSHDPAVINWFT